MDIRAFIFDLDGVITDTAEFHYLAWKRLADEEGIPFTREDNDQLRGVSRRESLLRLLKGRVIAEDAMQAWMTRKNDYYKAYLTDITPDHCLPGVLPFLQAAQAAGLQLGIGSASKNAQEVIERLGLTTMFGVIGDGYSVVNPKPAPDLFVWVSGALRVNVENAVVFEDAEAGIDAAKAAGCRTVGLGTANVQHADLRFDGLDQVSVADVLARLTR
jgi:beta-phosphoglucomutase